MGGFVADTLTDHGHAPERVCAISAADALAARLAGDTPPGEFGALLEALDRTLHAEFDDLRDRAARRQLRDLEDRLATTLEVEEEAPALTAADLAQRVGTFGPVVGEQRRTEAVAWRQRWNEAARQAHATIRTRTGDTSRSRASDRRVTGWFTWPIGSVPRPCEVRPGPRMVVPRFLATRCAGPVVPALTA